MAEPKVTVLPYVSPRCVVCGRDLPKGRRQKCHFCRPPKVYKPPEDPAPDQEYSLEDRVAQAEAYGLSYGQFMAIIENSWKLPPLRKRIRWPEGSVHAAE